MVIVMLSVIMISMMTVRVLPMVLVMVMVMMTAVMKVIRQRCCRDCFSCNSLSGLCVAEEPRVSCKLT